MSLVYLYCVTGEPSEGMEAAGGEEGVFFIQNNGIYAVVSTVNEDGFTGEGLKRNLSDIRWVESRVRMHEGVIERVMAHSTVIPFKFGTLFKTGEGMEAMLDNYHNGFKDLLERLKGKEEWGVKIYCDMHGIKVSIAEDERFKRIQDEIVSSASGKAYLLEKKKEGLMEDALHEKITWCSQESFELLTRQSIGARLNRPMPKELTGRKDEMLLNAAFLIERANVPEFIEAVNLLKGKYGCRGFSVDCTGPWPPYNFCQSTGSFGAEMEGTT